MCSRRRTPRLLLVARFHTARGAHSRRSPLLYRGSSAYKCRGYRCSGYKCRGYKHTGYCTGYKHTGYKCTGYKHTGYRCTGYKCTGYKHTGYKHTGYCTGYKHWYRLQTLVPRQLKLQSQARTHRGLQAPSSSTGAELSSDDAAGGELAASKDSAPAVCAARVSSERG